MNALERESAKLAASPEMQALPIDPSKLPPFVQTLLTLFSTCAPFLMASKTPKEFLTEHSANGVFERKLIRHARHSTVLAARQNGITFSGRSEADDATIVAFKHILNADESTVGACMAACPVEDGE